MANEEDTNFNVQKIKSDAIMYLIEGQEIEAASFLFASEIDILTNDYASTLIFSLKGNRAIYDLIMSEGNIFHQILDAFKAVENTGFDDIYVSAKIAYPDLGIDWEAKLLEAIQERKSPNQCKPINNTPTHEWKGTGLHFRSPVEIQIAEELDKLGILFFPNCMARLGGPHQRINREPDFLVCYKGKWGIIDIDGATYHTSAAKDHNRDRLFKIHGIRVCERYEAKRCMEEPDKVVKEFLNILVQNG
ncbi:hypothetical protein KSD_33630 [Ktedonobacter sp. SOSP1-85]|uniref:DUF559 domain-containing protein n=1 Tax=Ktedonobacter sp. SOSP1-85 TaxID=2778367 RepID=UPI0019156328|nr:DUF559 domain-containing protein [Ktedonobacter sp. SOSP1-85]GHO75592.1 hypothetical protein KSD_33630 [Ktedonobacter sp. SOSP1-85]